MTDVLWPTGIYPSSQEWGVVDNVGVFQSSLAGATRTVARTGARMSCKIMTPMLKGQDRARMKAFIASLRGKSNRAYIPDFSTTQRGSFPATELLTNNDFSSGTTGWQTSGSSFAMSVSDAIARVTRLRGDQETDLVPSASVAITNDSLYLARGFVSSLGRGTQSVGLFATDGTITASVAASASTGMRQTLIVPHASVSAYLFDANMNGSLNGAYFESPFMSLSRGIAADAAPDALLYSDQIDNAAWTKSSATVTANVFTAPDGTSTGDRLAEAAATAAHYFFQTASKTSGVDDHCAWCYVKQDVLDRDLRLVVSTSLGADLCECTFDLSAGTKGTATASGAASNPRSFIKDCGGGWYFCVVVGRMPSSTSIGAQFQMVAAGATSYLGTTGTLGFWRCGCAVSSLPTRGGQTTSSALATGTVQSGSGIYVKGLPASTSGLLKVGDPVERSGQINFLTAPLDSDAAGLGYLQCGNPWKSSVADNEPIIVRNPMSKMILVGDDMSYDTGPGQFSAFQLEFIEDVT